MVSSISVVIPNFNGASLLKQNLRSVIGALDHSGLNYEIIVSDDHSTDDSVSFLNQMHPEILVLQNPSDRGFSKNINNGIAQAKGSLVLCLNTDVSLDKDYFKYQIPFFEDPSTFGVMGALCNPETGKTEDGAKVFEQSFWGQIRSTTNLLPIDGSSLPTFFLSGANALIDREKVALLRAYDELFSPFYNEDVELGIRAWRMGWKCFFEPRAKAYHAVSKTIHAISSKKDIRWISVRNRFLLHFIHLNGTKRFLYFLKLFFNCTNRWVIADWSFYKALIAFWKLRSKGVLSQTRFQNLEPKFNLSQIKRTLEELQKEKECLVF